MNNDVASDRQSHRAKWVFYYLVAALFLMILVSSDLALRNARFIYFIQLAFIFLSLIALRHFPSLSATYRENKLVIFLVLFWIVGICASFALSPLPLLETDHAWERLIQTLVHFVFFAFVWDLFSRYELNLDLLLFPIAAVIVLLGATYLYQWHLFQSGALEIDWLNRPPYHSNVRHVGYIAAAAVSVFSVAFLCARRRAFVTLWFVFLLGSSTLLFWLGGRGAMLSAVAAILVSGFLFFRFMRPGYLRATGVLVALILGLLLSESFSIFTWSGASNSVAKSLNAGTVNDLSSQRLAIWATVIAAMEGHWFLGLGPQSYMHIPDRVCCSHPHSFIFQFLLEWGLLGLGIALALGFIFTRSLVRTIFRPGARPLTEQDLAAIALVVAMVVHGLFAGTLFFHHSVMYFLVGVAILLRRGRHNAA